jgi:hypothetical protein
MAQIDEDDGHLAITIGWPWFNGSTALFDRQSGEATIEGRNFFIPFRRTVPLGDIASVSYIRQKSAAYPRIELRTGRRIAMPSAGIKDAATVVPVMQRFLGVGGKLPP